MIGSPDFKWLGLAWFGAGGGGAWGWVGAGGGGEARCVIWVVAVPALLLERLCC